MKKHLFQAGFTMIELLVVISIIGILVAMGAASFTTAQRSARDGKRRSDIQQIQKGFEQYYADNTGYDTCGNMDDTTYFPAGLPVDPQLGTAYDCSASAAGFCVCAELEKDGSGNSSDSSCSFASTGNFFCAVNLQ